MLRRLLKQAVKDFTGVDADATPWAEDGFEALQAEGAQRRLPLGDDERKRPRAKRTAVLEGFSPHADTSVHANESYVRVELVAAEKRTKPWQ